MKKRNFLVTGVISISLGITSVFPSIAADESLGQISQPLTGTQDSFWPGVSIPVCWDTWVDGDTQARGWVQSALHETWEKHSAVRFSGWDACSGSPQQSDAIRIQIADVNPAVTKIGSKLRGVQGGMLLNFTFSTWTGGAKGKELCADGGNIPSGFPASGLATHREYCIKAIAVHEFGHALGFTHEDHRSDRFGCDKDHKAQGTAGDYKITSYDLQSVMNYCNPDWNGNGRLSFLDRWGAVAIYGGWSPDFAITPNNAAGSASNLAVAHRNSDELNIFYQGSDRALGTNWSNRTVNSGVWQKPFPITPPGATRANTPIAAVVRAKQLHVFYIGSDGALATTWTDGGSWATPFPITPPGAARGDSPITAILRGDQLHVFYIGSDGALGSTWAAPNANNGRWNAPFPITSPGAAGAKSQIATLLRGSQLHIFFQGGDRAIATAWSTPDVDDGRWKQAFPITPPGAAVAETGLSAVLRSDQLHVFYQGSDASLATTWSAPGFDGGRWQSPFPISPPGSGRLNSPIVALARNTDKLDVHYVGSDGAVATVWSNTRIQGGRWQQPYPITPPGFANGNSSITATSRFERMMDVFYIGQSGELKTLWANDPRRE